MTGMEKLAFADRETVEQYQVGQLRRLVGYVAARSPFYRDVLPPGIEREINTVADIGILPLTSKKDLQLHNDRFQCCSTDDVAEIVCTSGSTGADPIVHQLTSDDVHRLAYNERLSLGCAGITADDTVLISVAMDGLFIAGLAYYLGLRQIGARGVRVGPLDVDLQMRLLAGLPVSAIIGVPTGLIALGEACDRAGVNRDGKNLILIGETIRDRSLAVNSIGARLARVWPGCSLMSTYGNTELATACCECDRGQGGHAHPDLVYVEVLDDDGRPVPDGELGELVVTTFHARGMPLLRYRTGDVTFIVRGRCGCGRTGVRVGPIVGRREQMLKIRGVTTSPAAVADALIALDYVADYVIVASRSEDGSDMLAVSVVLTDGCPEHVHDRIAESVRSRARVRPEVRVVTPQQLHRMQYGTGSRKARRFIDHRDPRA